MACVAATENCFLDQGCGDFNVDEEFSNIDGSLVMSLLEDLREGDGDDEMLRAVIQSPEPEITNHDSSSESEDSDASSEDYTLFLDECCSTTLNHLQDFEWNDMEMAHSFFSYETAGYFTGNFTGNMIQMGGLEEDCSQVCYGMPMEEDDYISLWQ